MFLLKSIKDMCRIKQGQYVAEQKKLRFDRAKVSLIKKKSKFNKKELGPSNKLCVTHFHINLILINF